MKPKPLLGSIAAVSVALLAGVIAWMLPDFLPFPDRLAVIPESSARINNVRPYDAEEKWARNGTQAGLHLMNPTRVAFFDARIRERLRFPVRVLDIGCGGGLVSNALAALPGYEAIEGIDLSPEALSYAASSSVRLLGAEGAKRVRFQKASLYELPFGNRSFDAVIMSDVLEHLHDVPRALREAARVLKDGGVLVFDTLDRSLPSLLFGIIGAEYIVRLHEIGTHDWRLFIRPAELERALAGAGFSGLSYKAMHFSLRVIVELTLLKFGLQDADTMTGGFWTGEPSPWAASYIGYAVKA